MSRKLKMLLTLAGCLFILAAFAMLMIQTIDQKILSEADIKNHRKRLQWKHHKH